MHFSEHFGENCMILLLTVAKWQCIKLCTVFFLDHSIYHGSYYNTVQKAEMCRIMSELETPTSCHYHRCFFLLTYTLLLNFALASLWKLM